MPAWLQHLVPPARYTHYGLWSDQARVPKDTSTRKLLARQIGADDFQRLAWVRITDTALDLRTLPALEALQRIWLQP
jgi:hypothetical protein